MEPSAARFGDQLLDLLDEPIGRRHFIATDVIEPDIAKRALLPVTAVGDCQFVPMAFRPEAMHWVRAVQDREVAIQGEAAIGRTANLGHAELPIGRLICEDHSILLSIECPAESRARSRPCQMFDQ